MSTQHDEDELTTVELARLREIERCARGLVLTAHSVKIRDAVVIQWWDALRNAIRPPVPDLASHLEEKHRHGLTRGHEDGLTVNQLQAWHTLDHRLADQNHTHP